VSDLHELELLKARYCRFVDTKQWDAWRGLFADDARVQISAEGDTMAIDPFAETISALMDGIRTVHQCTLPELELTGPDSARGVWAFRYEHEWGDRAVKLPWNVLPGQHGFVAYGHYEEEYVRRDGEWRIAFLAATQLATWALVGDGMVAV
jgi:hypothetical protein